MEKMHIRPLTDLIHKRGGVIMLIKIEAIVREEKFEQVKSALQDIQVNGVPSPRLWGMERSVAIQKLSAEVK